MENNINTIQVLSAIEAVRKRKSQFIGEGTDPTECWREVIDNGKDEILSDYCNRLDIFKEYDNNNEVWYCVRDFGRGIPLQTNTGEDAIIAITNKLYSGGKFNDEKDSKQKRLYKLSCGTHGLGLTIINALSKKLIITTKAQDKDNNHVRYIFEDSKLISKNLIHLTSDNPNDIYSTEIKFIPDKKYFKNIICNEDYILNNLIVSKYVFGDNVCINFNGNIIQNEYINNFLGENCIESIVEKYKQKNSVQECEILIALYNDYDSGKVFKGIVNTLETDEGTHKNLVQNLLKNKLFNIAEKNKKHVQLNDLLIPIKINCVLKLERIAFLEQVKNSLCVEKEDIIKIIEPCIDSLIKKNKEFFDKVITFAEEYRVGIESNKNAKKSRVGNNAIKIEGLFDCSSKNPEERTLYIVEGISAASTIIKVRNPKYDSILALRGKVLNVLDNSTKKILENDVINSIAGALGFKIFGKIDPDRCRYRRGVCIVADGDCDGR